MFGKAHVAFVDELRGDVPRGHCGAAMTSGDPLTCIKAAPAKTWILPYEF